MGAPRLPRGPSEGNFDQTQDPSCPASMVRPCALAIATNLDDSDVGGFRKMTGPSMRTA